MRRIARIGFIASVLGLLGLTTAHSATSNLGLGMSAAPASVSVNELITWQLSVTNLGPNTANSVVVTNWLPPSATYFSATVSQGGFTTNSGGVVRYSIGTLAAGAKATASVTAFSGTPGTLTNRAWTASGSTDSSLSNNGATNSIAVVSTKFQLTGSLNLARKWHTATLLQNGKVLITGGTTSTGLTATAELYDPATGVFSFTGNMLGPRHQHTATLLNNGKVLMVGQVFSTSAELYDPATGTFTNTGSLNVSRWSHAASLMGDGRVLVTGGYADEGSAEVYNPASNTWSLAGRMNFSRVYHSSVLLPDGRTLLAGGYDAGNNADVFSPVTNGFAAGGNFLKSRSFASIVRMTNNTVLLAGGNDVALMFDAELYNPATQSSVSLGNLIASRFECPGVLLADGRALLAGGTGYLGLVTPTAELFNPVTATFAPTLSLNYLRTEHAATLLADGRVLVTGGCQDWPNGGSLLTSAEIFSPATAKTPPNVAATDAAVVEGNSGTNFLVFNLTLSIPLGVPASVNYSISAGTATAGDDFIPVAGTVIFPPGVTNQNVGVPVLGDVVHEPDETMMLNLASPTNVLLAGSTVTGTILNDEALPSLVVPGATVTETDRFPTNATISIQLSGQSSWPVTFTVATTNGSATAGLDYVSTNKAMVFAPGQTNLTFQVAVLADTLVEANETVLFNLTSVSNATVASLSPLTILDNDGIAGKIHHFEMDPMPNPSYLGHYAYVFIYAKDYLGNSADYRGPVYLDAPSPGLTNYHWDFEDGTLNGWTTLNPGYGDGPYEVVSFDTGGENVNNAVFFPSPAFRIKPNFGPADGLTRKVALVGGVPYNFSFSVAESNEGSAWEYAGADAQLYLNGVNIGGAGWSQYDVMAPGLVNRQKMSATYTPPTNGVYTLTLTVTRAVYQSDLWAYVDDIRIEAPRVTPLLQMMWVGLSVGQAIVRVHDLATNIVLRAYDRDGHQGLSNPFNVLPAAELGAYTWVATPDPGCFDQLSLGAYVLNLGSSPASGVIVSNTLPPGFTLLSAASAWGTCTNFGNTVVCTFTNALSAGSSGLVTITAKSAAVGFYTNHFTVAANEYDPVPENNATDLVIEILPPRVSARETAVMEIPGGTNAAVAFWLSSSNNVPVSVDFTTAGSGATAGLDFAATSGTVVFPPGVTTQQVSIPILDDTLDETNELFSVNLSNLTNALAGSPLSANVTITDDDLPPALTIGDASVLEGDAGQTSIGFPLVLSAPSGKHIGVSYVTSNGTAVVASDYIFTSGSLTIVPGQTNGTVSVSVIGNTVNEPDETFSLLLTNAGNATLARNQAVGTILNDDAVPGRFDHFVFDPVISPRAAQVPFRIAVQAVDFLGNPATNPPATAQLTATNFPNPGLAVVTPSVLSNFVGHVWTGNVTMPNVVTNASLRALDAAEHVGASNPFNVVAYYPFTLVLPVAATEGSGFLPGAGAIRTTNANDVDVWFSLGSNNTNALRVPLTVLLPAGQTNAPFDLTLMDDALLNGSRTVSVTATATNYATNAVSMKVHDNESATFTLTLPATATEKGSNPQATLTVSAPPTTNVSVTLTSSDTTEITVPATVTLAGGQTSVVFTATVVDDALIDGPQPVTITAHVENWTDGVGVITVFDNETTNLAIVILNKGQGIGEATIREGIGESTNYARVQLTGSLPTNLTVNLLSSDTSEFTVPASVIILAGQTNVNFNATFPEDGEFDGTTTNLITATAAGFGAATNTVLVLDNDIHHLVLGSITSPKTGGLPFSVTVSPRDVNNVVISGLTYPVTLTAAGDYGPVIITPTNFLMTTRNSVTVALNSWDTNVRITLTCTNGASGTSNPFNVVPQSVQAYFLAANDLAYDRVTDRIYAVVGTNDSAYPNSLTVIDPVHGVIGPSYPVGPAPDRVAIGDLGQFAYVSVPASNSVRRFNLTSQTVDREIPLGAGLTVDDLEVQPGQPAVLAVSRQQPGSVPRFRDVTVYSNGVAGQFSYSNTVANVIEFGTNSARLYGYDSETGASSVSRMWVGSAGVLPDNNGVLWTGVGVDFRAGNGRLHTTGGQVFEAESGALFGSYPWSGPVCVDPESGRVMSLRFVSGSTWELTVSAGPPPALAGTVLVSGVTGTPGSLIRCGESGVAFRTTGSQVFIMSSAMITDTDSDGLPDSWERRYFGGTGNPNGAASADADGDGHTNAQEWQAGTTPTNAASVLRLSAVRVIGNNVVLEFPTVSGRRYRVDRATNLPPVWQMLEQDVTGNNGIRSVVHTNGVMVGRQFYRVQLQP